MKLTFQGSAHFRDRLVLSIISGISINITHIRLKDDHPGIHEFEVSLLKLLVKLTVGSTYKINEDGTEVKFIPGLLNGGKIEHECSIERGLGYYLEVLCMLGPFCKKPLNAKLWGVTANNIDPSVDNVKHSFFNVIKQFIIEEMDLQILKRGTLPNGGGEIVFKCPLRPLKSINLTEPGKVKRIRGTAFVSRMSPAMANRVVDKAKNVLLNFIPDVYITTDQCKGKRAGESPGYGVHLYAETMKGIIYSSDQVSKVISEGEDPLTPEEIGETAAQRLLYEIYSGGITDSSSQAIAILNIAIGQKDISKIVLGALTDRSIGLLRHIKQFLGVIFNIEPFDMELEGTGGQKILLTAVGAGFTNMNKPRY